MAGKLAKESCNLPIFSSYALTFLEFYSLKKSENVLVWRVPFTHHWLAGNRPGLDIALKCTRSRLASGHIKYLSFSANKKVYLFCARCCQASSEHIMLCMDLKSKDIFPSCVGLFESQRFHGSLTEPGELATTTGH
ncbi:uncharacterized protein TNCV_4112431 [Trichonephila clavipes]|nr:uncharacterized protein TNCV_4112431 [Trichonephila clavipes]